MLSYHYVHEELNKRILRVLHTMLLAYVLPLWMQLIYMGEASGDAAEPVMIWHQSVHPMFMTLLLENLTMLGYVIVLEIVQERVRNFWLYTGAHSGCIGVMWITLQESAGRIPRLIICIVLMICAYYARIQETHIGYPSIGWLSIGILMVITAQQTQLHDMQFAGCVVEVLTALLFAMYYNVISIEHALQHTRGAGSIPYDKVHQTNIVVMILSLFLMTVMMMLIILIGIGDHFLDILGVSVVWCVKQIARFIAYLLSLLPEPEQIYQSTSSMVDQFEIGDVNPVTSIFMIILMAIWETLMAVYQIVGMILTVWIFVQCGKWLYRTFQSAELETPEDITWKRSRERTVWFAEREPNRLSPIDPRPSARIRRCYIRFVRKGPGYYCVRPSMTPGEILTVSVNEALEQISMSESNHSREWFIRRLERMNELYECARYVPSQCTMRDAAEMHQIMRELREELLVGL